MLNVQLVSPERILYSGDATMVICRTVSGGDIAFLTGHTKFIGALAIHPVRIQHEDRREDVFDRHEHRSSPFTADANALREPQDHQRDGCPRPDLRVGREQSDPECRHPHDDERQDEHRPPAHSVAVVADDDAPDRPRGESD